MKKGRRQKNEHEFGLLVHEEPITGGLDYI